MQRQKHTLRRVSIAVGAFLVSLPFLVALLNTTYDLGGALFLLLPFLGFWTLIITLVSQSRKVFFWGAVVIPPIPPIHPIQPTGPMYAEGEKLYSYPQTPYEQKQ